MEVRAGHVTRDVVTWRSSLPLRGTAAHLKIVCCRVCFCSFLKLWKRAEVRFGAMFVRRLPWLCLFAVFHIGSAYDPDEVTSLPGMTFRSHYKQWSGYLQTRPGRFLHYWWELITNPLSSSCKLLSRCIRSDIYLKFGLRRLSSVHSTLSIFCCVDTTFKFQNTARYNKCRPFPILNTHGCSVRPFRP